MVREVAGRVSQGSVTCNISIWEAHRDRLFASASNRIVNVCEHRGFGRFRSGCPTSALSHLPGRRIVRRSLSLRVRGRSMIKRSSMRSAEMKGEAG